MTMKLGDILDRLSILQLKIAAASFTGAPASHFEAEFDVLDRALFDDLSSGRPITVPDILRTLEFAMTVAGINGRLWEMQTWARKCPDVYQAPDRNATEGLKTMVLLNDARAAGVQRLNRVADPSAPREKL